MELTTLRWIVPCKLLHRGGNSLQVDLKIRKKKTFDQLFIRKRRIEYYTNINDHFPMSRAYFLNNKLNKRKMKTFFLQIYYIKIQSRIDTNWNNEVESWKNFKFTKNQFIIIVYFTIVRRNDVKNYTKKRRKIQKENSKFMA